ncbi:hypothetical protein KCU61_g104, partial [Aureobasidium melanogenum]
LLPVGTLSVIRDCLLHLELNLVPHATHTKENRVLATEDGKKKNSIIDTHTTENNVDGVKALSSSTTSSRFKSLSVHLPVKLPQERRLNIIFKNISSITTQLGAPTPSNNPSVLLLQPILGVLIHSSQCSYKRIAGDGSTHIDVHDVELIEVEVERSSRRHEGTAPRDTVTTTELKVGRNVEPWLPLGVRVLRATVRSEEREGVGVLSSCSTEALNPEEPGHQVSSSGRFSHLCLNFDRTLLFIASSLLTGSAGTFILRLSSISVQC